MLYAIMAETWHILVDASESMPHLTLTLFDTFQAYLDGAPLTNFHSVRVQGLLAYLALKAARPHTPEALMALLWPDDASQSAQQSLRQALYTLRRLLGDTDNPARESAHALTFRRWPTSTWRANCASMR